MLEPLNLKPCQRRSAGLTLLELLIGLAVVSLLISLAAPSFSRMIAMQRVRSINAALVTDLQFARAEAISRNDFVRVRFDKSGSTVTCYVIMTGDASACDCRNTPGVNVCSGPANKELRTVQVERSLGITLGVPDAQLWSRLAFDPATGRLLVAAADVYELPGVPFVVEVKSALVGGFEDSLLATGRPSVCTPSGQIPGVSSC